MQELFERCCKKNPAKTHQNLASRISSSFCISDCLYVKLFDCPKFALVACQSFSVQVVSEDFEDVFDAALATQIAKLWLCNGKRLFTFSRPL